MKKKSELTHAETVDYSNAFRCTVDGDVQVDVYEQSGKRCVGPMCACDNYVDNKIMYKLNVL